MTTTGPGADLTESEFDRGVAVTSQPDDSSACYGAELDGGWSIRGGMDGGVLLAVCANALKQTFAADGHPDPFSISAYHLGRPCRRRHAQHGCRTPRAQHVHWSRVADADRRQPSGRAGAGVGDVRRPGGAAAGGAHHRRGAGPPGARPVPWHGSGPAVVPRERSSLRPDRPEARPGLRGVGDGGTKRSRTDARLAAARRRPGAGPLFLLVALDALPPATFDLGLAGWSSWAPTLELTAHVRALPAPGWLKVAHSTRNFAGGLLEEDAEVWDSAGRLVAQSRQLARAPR